MRVRAEIAKLDQDGNALSTDTVQTNRSRLKGYFDFYSPILQVDLPQLKPRNQRLC